VLLLLQTEGDIQTAIRERQEKYDKYNLKLGPQAIVVGPGKDTIMTSYVRINDVVYAVENPLKALDITFKAMIVFDSPYHAECRREWFFLQTAVYGIKCRDDKKMMDPKTAEIIEDYKKFKSQQKS